MLRGCVVGGVDLLRVVPAESHRPERVVAHVRHQALEARVDAEEVLARVSAAGNGVFLVLAVNDLAHSLDEHALVVFREQIVPLAAPEHLDHVPADAAEDGLQFLDDLAVASDRAVEALQVAVDDEDQVVEVLA